MKLLLVNQHYPPDSGATGKLLAQLARSLVRRGHDVTVLTGRPTYREAMDRRAPRREWRDGVRVLRVPLLGRNDAPLLRALHYLSFAAAVLLRGPWISRPDAVMAMSSTPLFGGAAAALLARILGSPFVYVVQDVYPEVAVAMGVLRPGRLERTARLLESFAWRAADRVVVIGPEMMQAAGSRGVEPSRVTVIPNWADPTEILPSDGRAFRREAGLGDDDFVVEYAGNLGRSQDLDAVLEAIRIVERKTSPERPVRFLFVGGGAREDDVREAARTSPAVRWVPRQPEERLSEVLSAADLSLVPLRPGFTRWCVPSKVYSILASGRPVGACLDADSEVARLVERAGCGFRVDAGDPAGLAAEILHLAEDADRAAECARRARHRAEAECSRELAVDRYEDLLEGIVRSSRRDRLPT